MVFRACVSGLIALLLSFCAVCVRTTAVYAADDTKKYNVILICLDTLRADHLGCYGYFRNTSPNIDKLAKQGIIFEQAFAQSSFTLPSMASLFTSKYVESHKVDSVEKRLSRKELTLAEVLKENGYRTAAFIYNAHELNPAFGLDRGFQTYYFGSEKNRQPSFVKTMPAALKWINDHRAEDFFVFLHSNDIHDPYHSIYEDYFDRDYKGRLDNEYFGCENADFRDPQNIVRSPREIKHIIAHYDAGIKYADSFIPGLMMKLRDLNLIDKTIIIIFSDHGEILADRGIRFLHGFSVHDEETRVPLIIVHPGIKTENMRVDSQVQLIDLMPTILQFLDIERTGYEFEGRSLLGVIQGKKEREFNRYVFAECLKGSLKGLGKAQEAVNYQIMVRSRYWKLISSVWKVKGKTLPKKMKFYNGAIISLPQKDGYELYDLKNDPFELNNLAGRNSNIELELMKELYIWQQHYSNEEQPDNSLLLDAASIERLKKAGYW